MRSFLTKHEKDTLTQRFRDDFQNQKPRGFSEKVAKLAQKRQCNILPKRSER